MTATPHRRKTATIGAAAIGMTLLLADTASAQTAGTDYVALNDIEGVRSSRLLDNGDLELVMDDGRTIRIASENVVNNGGAIAVEASALAEAGLAAGAAAGGGISTGLIVGGLGALAAGGAAVAASGSGEQPVPNTAPTITSLAAASLAENSTATALSVTATDAQNNPLTFSIAGGADAALFAIDPSTGALRLLAAPNFETPADANRDNLFDVTVAVSDGVATTTQDVRITVTNVNDVAPVITSAAAFSIAENSTTGFTVTTTDVDGGAPTFTLSGADAALFAVSAAGVVTFRGAPDFEAPGDAGRNNVFDLVVTASDGVASVSQAIAITVTNLNDVAPVITSAAAFSVIENRNAAFTAIATDVEGGPLTFALSGADAALFAVDAAGIVTFRDAPDFEVARDAGSNNVYDVVVTASDGVNTTSQTVAVSVTDAPGFTGTPGNDILTGTAAQEEFAGLAGNDRVFAGGGSDTIATGSGQDRIVFAGDPFDGGGAILTQPGRQFAGNEDFVTDFDFAGDVIELNARDFGVAGELSFAKLDATAPGATIPDGANVIVLTNAGPPFNAGLAANQVAGLINTDGPGFIVYFNTPLNVTRIIFSTNLNDPTADIKILTRHIDLSGPDAIAALNNFTAANFDFDRAPVFSSAATASVIENRTTAFTAIAADGDGTPLTFTLSGADAGLFQVSATGVVTFRAAPDFEAPADAGANNVYDVVVTASDGVNTTSQAVAVSVTDAPGFTGTPGNDILTGTVAQEEFSGLAGNDHVFAGGGSDTIATGAGNDRIVFAGDPFDGGGAILTQPGRQFGGNEDFVTDFDFATPLTAISVASASTTPAVLSAALAGRIYFNVHSTAFPGGEVRGQAALVSDNRAADGTGSVTFNSTLNGANEVANSPVVTVATGVATITFTVAADGTVTYTTQIDLRDFDVARLTVGHLHEAPVGSNGPVVLDIVANARTSGSIGGSVEADVIELNARDFGVAGELSFAKLDATAPGATIPDGANVIVLTNAGPPFNAGLAANQVAGLINTDGPGFIVYFNTPLNVTRIIFSTNLNDPTADIKILTRHIDLTGPDAIAALNNFTAANFDFAGDLIVGTSAANSLSGTAASDVIAGLAGVDTIATGAGNDTVAFDATAIGSGPDQLTDFDVAADRFLIDAAEFGVTGPLVFQSALAADLVNNGSNVIVLLDGDNDANAATPFNARTSAQLIATGVTDAGPGFFVYFNSVLNVNRLAFSQNLADGNAPLTLLGAVTNVTGQDAIAQLADFEADNFTFGEAPAASAVATQASQSVSLSVVDDEAGPSLSIAPPAEASATFAAVSLFGAVDPFVIEAFDPPVPHQIEAV